MNIVQSWTPYGAPVNGWQMYYIKSSQFMPDSLTFLAGNKAHLRIYNKLISDAAIADLYNDVAGFEGKRYLPGFRKTEDT